MKERCTAAKNTKKDPERGPFFAAGARLEGFLLKTYKKLQKLTFH
jgi:hypothetical protein